MAIYRVTHLLTNWVGLTLIWDVPRLVGRYCSYLLPKQAGGTSQIKVNPTDVRQEMCHTVHFIRIRATETQKHRDTIRSIGRVRLLRHFHFEWLPSLRFVPSLSFPPWRAAFQISWLFLALYTQNCSSLSPLLLLRDENLEGTSDLS